MKHQLRHVAASAAGLALLLSGCGDDGGSSADTTTSQPATTSPSTTTTAGAAAGSTTTSAGGATTTTVSGTLLKTGTAKLQLGNAVTATIEAPLVPGSGRYRARFAPPPGDMCLGWKDPKAEISMEIHANPAGCATSFTGSATTSDKLKVYLYTDEPDFIFVSEKGECRLTLEAGGASGAELTGSVDCTGIPASGLFGSGKEGAADLKGTFTAAP